MKQNEKKKIILERMLHQVANENSLLLHYYSKQTSKPKLKVWRRCNNILRNINIRKKEVKTLK